MNLAPRPHPLGNLAAHSWRPYGSLEAVSILRPSSYLESESDSGSTASLLSILYHDEDLSCDDISKSNSNIIKECNQNSQEIMNFGEKGEVVLREQLDIDSKINDEPMKQQAVQRSLRRIVASRKGDQPRTNGSTSWHDKNSPVYKTLNKNTSSCTPRSGSTVTSSKSATAATRSVATPSGSSATRSANTRSASSATKSPPQSSDFHSSISTAVDAAQLTAWEKWLLGKEAEARRLQEQRREKKAQEAAERKKALDEEATRAKIRQQRVLEWHIKKEEMKQRSEVVTNEEKPQKKKFVDVERVYLDWLDKENKKRLAAKEALLKEEAAKAVKAAEKAKLSQEAYEKWLQHSKGRARTEPYSYGYADGQLTSYYDLTANPAPSFINPEPWMPLQPTKAH